MPQALPYIVATAAALSAGKSVYDITQGGPKAQGQPQAAKDPTADVYKSRNAQNTLVGGDSTGTGSYLSSSSNVAGNVLGQ